MIQQMTNISDFNFFNIQNLDVNKYLLRERERERERERVIYLMYARTHTRVI
jgi:hypothetical protein